MGVPTVRVKLGQVSSGDEVMPRGRATESLKRERLARRTREPSNRYSQRRGRLRGASHALNSQEQAESGECECIRRGLRNHGNVINQQS